MGIPSYFSKIIKDYNIIFKNLNDKLQCHNFFLDSNSIIYDIIHSLTIMKLTVWKNWKPILLIRFVLKLTII